MTLTVVLLTTAAVGVVAFVLLAVVCVLSAAIRSSQLSRQEERLRVTCGGCGGLTVPDQTGAWPRCRCAR